MSVPVSSRPPFATISSTPGRQESRTILRRASHSTAIRPLSPGAAYDKPIESWRLLSRQFPWLSTAEAPLKAKVLALLAARGGQSSQSANLLGAVLGRLGHWLAKAHAATFGRLFWLAFLASLKNGAEQFNQARSEPRRIPSDTEVQGTEGR